MGDAAETVWVRSDPGKCYAGRRAELEYVIEGFIELARRGKRSGGSSSTCAVISTVTSRCCTSARPIYPVTRCGPVVSLGFDFQRLSDRAHRWPTDVRELEALRRHADENAPVVREADVFSQSALKKKAYYRELSAPGGRALIVTGVSASALFGSVTTLLASAPAGRPRWTSSLLLGWVCVFGVGLRPPGGARRGRARPRRRVRESRAARARAAEPESHPRALPGAGPPPADTPRRGPVRARRRRGLLRVAVVAELFEQPAAPWDPLAPTRPRARGRRRRARDAPPPRASRRRRGVLDHEHERGLELLPFTTPTSVWTPKPR